MAGSVNSCDSSPGSYGVALVATTTKVEVVAKNTSLAGFDLNGCGNGAHSGEEKSGDGGELHSDGWEVEALVGNVEFG